MVCRDYIKRSMAIVTFGFYLKKKRLGLDGDGMCGKGDVGST